MGATDRYGLPWPEGPDLPWGPQPFQALAQATEDAIAGVATRTVLGADTSSEVWTTISAGNTWTTQGVHTVTADAPGTILVLGSVQLNRPDGGTGTPEARCSVAGPATQVAISEGTMGIGTEVDRGSVTTLTLCTVTAPGTLTLQRQVRHNAAASSGGQWRRFDLYWALSRVA